MLADIVEIVLERLAYRSRRRAVAAVLLVLASVAALIAWFT